MGSRLILLVLVTLFGPGVVAAQECPTVLSTATRLVLVTAQGMNSTFATAQLFERASSNDPWRKLGPPEPAVIGRAGMAWAPMFRHLARPGEPIKIEGDKRAPAGIYPIGGTFGTVPSDRPGHIQVREDTVCVDDPSSPAYNTITTRQVVGPKVHAENMGKALPMYRHGLLVDYPTDAAGKAGSCIFIHVWRSPTRGTAGCVALPEERVLALQDFAVGGGTVLAVMPRHALHRLGGCLPTSNGR
ncbi:MAG TPA: L,D-transpeptidase family protein [Xanthobacteraceae bacterium]|nr:L,D-transpeptidase family protein [Xanthobacteraceae bacterium]